MYADNIPFFKLIITNQNALNRFKPFFMTNINTIYSKNFLKFDYKSWSSAASVELPIPIFCLVRHHGQRTATRSVSKLRFVLCW